MAGLYEGIHTVRPATDGAVLLVRAVRGPPLRAGGQLVLPGALSPAWKGRVRWTP